MTNEFSLETLAVRAGQERSQFGEHAEALYLTSSFVFENAAQAAARFSGAEEGNVYARFYQSDGDHAAGAAGRPGRRRGLRRHRQRHGGHPVARAWRC